MAHLNIYTLSVQLLLCVQRSASTMYLYALCGSHNKLQDLPYTALTVWFCNRKGEFYCFTVHFNSLNVTHQLMHFQYNNILV